MTRKRKILHGDDDVLCAGKIFKVDAPSSVKHGAIDQKIEDDFVVNNKCRNGTANGCFIDGVRSNIVTPRSKRTFVRTPLIHKYQRLKKLRGEKNYVPIVRRFDIERHTVSVEQANFFKRPLFQQVTVELRKQNFDFTFHHIGLLSEIIKQNLLTQNMGVMSYCMLPLVYRSLLLPEMIYKIGCLILSSTTAGGKLLASFVNMMKSLIWKTYRFQSEILLNSTVESLYHTDINEVYQNLCEKISYEPHSDNAYVGLTYGQLEYALWKIETKMAVKADVKLSWNDDDDDDDVVEDQEEIKQTSIHLQRALHYLSISQLRMGVWDQIIPKYIDLVLHHRGAMSAVDCMRESLRNNSDNPMMYWYLCKLLEKHDADSLVETIEQLAQKDVTNPLMIKLIEHYQKNGQLTEALQLVIKRLDHVTCMSSAYDWKTLHCILCERNRKGKFIRRLIAARPTWTSCHFPVPLNNLNRKLPPHLLRLKVKIAEHLRLDAFAACVRSFLFSDHPAQHSSVNAMFRRIFLTEPNNLESVSDVSTADEASFSDSSDDDELEITRLKPPPKRSVKFRKKPATVLTRQRYNLKSEESADSVSSVSTTSDENSDNDVS